MLIRYADIILLSSSSLAAVLKTMPHLITSQILEDVSVGYDLSSKLTVTFTVFSKKKLLRASKRLDPLDSYQRRTF